MSEPNRMLVTVSGLQTAWAAYGDGPVTVLALHGWGGSIESFWSVAQQLGRFGHYTIHVVDLPGFGQTSRPPEPWGVPEYAEFVLAYLDAQEIARTHLLGHSFGGRISLILGADHGDRIGKMVLANSAGVPNPPDPLREAITKAGKAVLGLPGLNRFYEPVRRRIGSADYLEANELKESFLKVIGQNLLPYAARVSCPTLLIWGDRDTETPLWQGRKLEAAIPDAGMVVYAGAGHFSYQERLPDYVRVVNHFLMDDSEESQT